MTGEEGEQKEVFVVEVTSKMAHSCTRIFFVIYEIVKESNRGKVRPEVKMFQFFLCDCLIFLSRNKRLAHSIHKQCTQPKRTDTSKCAGKHRVQKERKTTKTSFFVQKSAGPQTRKMTSVAMSGSRVGRGSQKSRSSQKDSSTGTTPTQKTRDIAVTNVTAGDIEGD